MNMLKLAFSLFLLGIIFIVLSALLGGEVDILLVIPIFHGTGALAAIGILLIIMSIILIMVSFTRGLVFEEAVRIEPEAEKRKVKGGGIVMLGPIPIIFGTDKTTVIILIMLVLILIAAMALFLLFVY